MASKKVKKVEAIASKSVDDIAKELAQIQQKSRETLSQIDAAFVEKQQELIDTMDAIKDKKAELEELHGKEKIAQEIERLEEELHDARHDHERALARMRVEFDDAKIEQDRAFKMAQVAEKQRIADEARARKLAHEDEDRTRQLSFEEVERRHAQREAELNAQAEELGSFEERLNKEVGKAKGMAERAADQRIKQIEVEHKAVTDILEAKIQSQVQEIEGLKIRLETAETTAKLAQDRASAIATASLDKEAGKAALEQVSGLAKEMAMSGKR